jgi:single-stranded DNA-specific DHH superfamily exonuclease
MSLDAAAATLASRLLEQEFVEVLAHHDADGIAAASILCHAMFRAGGRFRLRIRPDITPEEIPREGSVLLCDFGSALQDLPDDVMVVDHHQPRFEGELHVNPHLAGIDGDRNLSAAGAAYLVARKMGDNRDLAGLTLLGIIGDGQVIEGPNRVHHARPRSPPCRERARRTDRTLDRPLPPRTLRRTRCRPHTGRSSHR